MTHSRYPWLEERAPGLVALGRQVVWLLDDRGRRSRRRVRSLRGRHAGDRCFIIGNGPSLRRMDLRHLATEVTFTLNRGYLLYEAIGGPSTYHVVVNPLVAEQWAGEIQRIPGVKFIDWGLRHWFGGDPDVVYVGRPGRPPAPRFSTDVTKSLWSGATVTYVALQLAYYLGFHQVVLIGVDHRFQAQGSPHQEVVATGEDVNHFAPNYFGTGSRWNLPDLETSELAYILARHYYRLDGREILDATVGGALQVFPKVDYLSLFR